MYATKLKELKLDESKKIGYTYKTLGAGFWALRQKDFRTALQEIVMAVSIKLLLIVTSSSVGNISIVNCLDY